MAIIQLLPQLEECFKRDASGVAALRRFGPRMQMQVYRAAYKQTENWGIDNQTRQTLAQEAVSVAAEDIKAASDAELLAAIELMYELKEADK